MRKAGKFFWVRLPVLGELGTKTVLPQGQAGSAGRLHCVLDAVPKTRLFKIHSTIAEASLAEELQEAKCSGFEVRDGMFELSKQAKDLAKTRFRLPKFVWLNVCGRAGSDDLGMDRGRHLIVSERAKAIIERGPRDSVEFVEGSAAPPDEEISAKIWEEARAVAEAARTKMGNRSKSPFIFTQADLESMVAMARAGDPDQDLIPNLRRVTGCMEIEEVIASASPTETPAEILERAMRSTQR